MAKNDDTIYDTLEEMEAAKANGYVTVVVYQKTSRKGFVQTLTTVRGTYDTKKKARNAAIALRAKIRRDLQKYPEYYESTKLLSVNVEAVWKP